MGSERTKLQLGLREGQSLYLLSGGKVLGEIKLTRATGLWAKFEIHAPRDLEFQRSSVRSGPPPERRTA